MTSIGEFRHKVTVERVEEVQDPETGIINEEWRTFFSTWAIVETLTGDEAVQAKQLSASATHRLILRGYREGVIPKMRVKFGEHYFDIQVVIDPLFRRINQELLCQEVDIGNV